MWSASCSSVARGAGPFRAYAVASASFASPPAGTLPYLSRVLGVEHFGVLGIALGVVSVMTLITDWGFSLSATQQVARHANDPETLRRILWDTYWARLGLGAMSFLGLGIVMTVVPSVGELGVVMLAAAVQVLASTDAPAQLQVRWPGGKTTITVLPAKAREITVDDNGKLKQTR